MQKFTASFLGRDCPGVVANVSRILEDSGCNIEEVTQTILSGAVSYTHLDVYKRQV